MKIPSQEVEIPVSGQKVGGLRRKVAFCQQTEEDDQETTNSPYKGPQYQHKVVFRVSMFGIEIMFFCTCLVFGYLDPKETGSR